MKHYTTFDTPLCNIILAGDSSGLSNLHLNTGLYGHSFVIPENWVRNDIFFGDIKDQINEYFRGERTRFDIVINLEGTKFQKKVWNALSQIPFGTVCSYKDVATAIGNPKASRAVGMANSKNPVPLIIPCHRVIGSDGKMTGFAYGIELKEKIIQFEKNCLSNQQY